MNTNEQIKELKQIIIEANAEIKRLEREANDGKPKVGQTYWRLDSTAQSSASVWQNGILDNARWDADNVYLTEQEAKNTSSFKLAVVAINREIRRLNKLESPVWVTDFNNAGQRKYFPMFDYQSKKWMADYCNWIMRQFTFEYGSEQTIKSMLKSHAKDFEIVKNGGAV